MVICYHYGYGTVVDLAKAYDLYFEAANGGYDKDMELVGRFYNQGIYVEQNRERAECWLKKAMEASDPDAVEEREQYQPMKKIKIRLVVVLKAALV